MAKSGDRLGCKLKALAIPYPQKDSSSFKLLCLASSVVLAQELWMFHTVVVSPQSCQGYSEEE